MFGGYERRLGDTGNLTSERKIIDVKREYMSKNMLYMGSGSIRFSRFGNILTKVGIELYSFFDDMHA